MTPHCLAAIFDSQLPSPKLSLKMPPKLPLSHKRNCPRGEGKCGAIERQKLSRSNFCLAASRCLSRPSGLTSLESWLLKSERAQFGKLFGDFCQELSGTKITSQKRSDHGGRKSRSASGGCLQGGASFKGEKAHFAA